MTRSLIVRIGSVLFFVGFIVVWLVQNRAGLPALAADFHRHPGQWLAALTSAGLFAAWIPLFFLHLERPIRAAVGRAFGVTITIEPGYFFQFRTTFVARTADGRRAGFFLDLMSTSVVFLIWILALWILPIGVAGGLGLLALHAAK